MIKHEHYHFYEDGNRNQYKSNNNDQNRATVPQLTPNHEGVSFGYNDYPGYVNDGPRFRSSIISTDDITNSNAEADKVPSVADVKKRQATLNPSVSFPDKSDETKTLQENEESNGKPQGAFSFPKSDSSSQGHSRSKRDDHPPYSLAPEPSKTAEAVRRNTAY